MWSWIQPINGTVPIEDMFEAARVRSESQDSNMISILFKISLRRSFKLIEIDYRHKGPLGRASVAHPRSCEFDLRNA